MTPEGGERCVVQRFLGFAAFLIRARVPRLNTRMRNRYYIEGQGRADGVRDLFAAIAPRYDLVNDLQSFGLHRGWKRRLIRLAEVRPGERALDVCCGTGDLAFALAREGAVVTGLDFSEPMLEVARRRRERWELPGGGGGGSRAGGPPDFQGGDALSLPFEEGTFDLVTIGYGLRNLRDLDAGLAEMRRVTRDGGRMLVLDFGKPAQRWWRALYFLHLRIAVPVLGRLFCGDRESHAYILESLRRYPEAAEVGRRMEGAGWREVRWWNLLGGVMTIHRGRAGAVAGCPAYR